jgi:hypothetical protein
MSRATQFLAVAFGARLQAVAPLDHVESKLPGSGGSLGNPEGPASEAKAQAEPEQPE